MRAPETVYDRLVEVSEELWAIEAEDAAAKTFIGGEAFDNEAWLAAEREALQDERLRIEETVAIDGTFAGVDS